MQEKLLTLCIDASMGCNRLAECLDSVVIIPSVASLDTLLLVAEGDEDTEKIAQNYIARYPELIRTEVRNYEKTFVQQSSECALGKYLRPIGSDCVVEPSDMDLLLRFLTDCDDDMVVHGCSVTDKSTGEKSGYSVPLGMIGRGVAVEYAATMMSGLPSQAAIFKTELVRRGGGIKNWGNDYSEFFVSGLMQTASVGGVDADLCRFTAPVSLVFTDAEALEQTVFNLIELLNAYTTLTDKNGATKMCIANRIANLALSRLELWLCAPCDAVVRDEIYSFFNKLRRANKDVFECFAENKYAKRLCMGKLMYRMVAKSYQKKNK
ncbi:MAG: hypothetical protein IJF58_06385 [Clostridia bacterium]|nr:hypothetical protein [Clostridia bacterium]